MANDGRSSTTPPMPPQTSGSALGFIGQSSQPSQLPPVFSQESADRFEGWKIIVKRVSYDEQDLLHPSLNLANEGLRARGEDDVVIFDYSLDPDYISHADRNPRAGEDGPSSGHLSADDDIFFRVPKKEFLGSKQFDQIINPTKEPQLILSRRLRLNIM